MLKISNLVLGIKEVVASLNSSLVGYRQTEREPVARLERFT
jgi:hypothetical protein